MLLSFFSTAKVFLDLHPVFLNVLPNPQSPNVSLQLLALIYPPKLFLVYINTVPHIPHIIIELSGLIFHLDNYLVYYTFCIKV